MRRAPPVTLGARYGRLVVIEGPIRHGRSQKWRCQCDCGTQTTVYGDNLRRGASRSCGCLNREVARSRETTHGQTGTRLYERWKGMLQRCEYPGHNRFAQYGGRGIRVCERWHRFEAFAADMGPIPPGMTLERLNPNGDYEPGNCVWASRAVQAASRRPVTTRLNGQPLSVFARAHGFDRENFARRVRRSGLAGHDWDVSGSGPGEVLDISGQQLHFMAAGSQSRPDAPA